MKTTSRIILSIMAVIAIAPVALILAQSTNKEPSGEFWVNVNSSTNLNVSRLRTERENSRLERKEFLITLEQYRQSGERNREAIEKLATEVSRIADKLCNLPH